MSGSAQTQSPAATYPSKAVHLVVPFPPGGVTDRLARVLGQKMQESWGQPVVVDNRPGAGGTIAADLVAKSAPDGYTLMIGSHATHAINVSIFGSRLPYDAVNSFAPISLLISVPNVLLLHPSVPANSVKELIELAKAKPGKLNFSSAGVGTSGHMAGELLKSLSGIDMVHVPNKGPAQALQDVVSGQVDMVFDSVALSLPLVRAGKLKALAVTSLERSPTAANLPTMVEAGVPGYEIVLWFAALAPADTPAPIVAKLNAEMVRILGLAEVREMFVNDGVTIIGSSHAALAAHIKREIVKWDKLVKATGARVD